MEIGVLEKPEVLAEPKEPKVYHVANPEIGGIVTKEIDAHWVAVVFDSPVGFSGKMQSGLRTEWGVSRNLLFSSPEEAWRNRNHSGSYWDHWIKG